MSSLHGRRNARSATSFSFLLGAPLRLRRSSSLIISVFDARLGVLDERTMNAPMRRRDDY